MSTPAQPFAPGAYKFTVKSAADAVRLIREKLGPSARVLSVRAVEASGFRRFFSGPRLEVIAQIDPVPPAAASLAAVSGEPALPPSAELPASRLTPPPASSAGLASLLRRSGLTETALSRLQSGTRWSELNTLPLHRALAETSRLLQESVGSRQQRPPISRAAFLGTPGVGRTTALCKWLAVEVFRRARFGHVVTVEFDHPNALGPLPVFSDNPAGNPVAL